MHHSRPWSRHQAEASGHASHVCAQLKGAQFPLEAFLRFPREQERPLPSPPSEFAGLQVALVEN